MGKWASSEKRLTMCEAVDATAGCMPRCPRQAPAPTQLTGRSKVAPGRRVRFIVHLNTANLPT